MLFVVALELNERDNINVAEAIFMIYALGFSLEKVAAMQEHGIKGLFPWLVNGLAWSSYFLKCTLKEHG